MRDDTRTGNRALRATLILCVAALGLALGPAPAGATPEPDQGIERFFEFQGVPDDLEEPWREFVEGWSRPVGDAPHLPHRRRRTRLASVSTGRLG